MFSSPVLFGRKAVRGAFLYTTDDSNAVYHRDGIILTETGTDGIDRIIDSGGAEEIAIRYQLNLSELPSNEGLIIPGLFDIHFHWVQDLVREMPKASLLEWLEKYTFPEESRFAEAEYAKKMAQNFWKDIRTSGTIGGLCYSSIHDVAVESALSYAPEGFLVGNVLMTMNCPEYLKTTTDFACRSVRANAEKFASRYICSPRFAPTTDPRTMKFAADVAKEFDLFQQTHLGETTAEIEWVLGIYRSIDGFENVRSYTDIYRRCGMLGPKTVFGHCIHMQEDEWKMLADSQSAIASCPTSNAPIEDLGLGSGLFDFRSADAQGVRWALASDIGGGPYFSMFDVMRSFVQQNQRAGRKEANYTRALYRASRAGAIIMNLNKGDFSPGRDFDPIQLDLDDSILDQAESAEFLLASILDPVHNRKEFVSVIHS